MITEALFLVSYLILLPIAFMFPFGGALAYEWLQYMPPDSVYNAGAFSNLSLIIGAVALSLWAGRDKKVMPKPTALFALFVIYALWLQLTQLTSIVPNDGGYTLWDRSYKTLGFTIILSMMARTPQRVEAFIWVVCLAIGNEDHGCSPATLSAVHGVAYIPQVGRVGSLNVAAAIVPRVSAGGICGNGNSTKWILATSAPFCVSQLFTPELINETSETTATV